MAVAQAYTALLESAVKCGEAELAVDVYGQLRAQCFQLEPHVFHVVLEVFLKLGRWQDALSVMDDMAAQVLCPRGQCSCCCDSSAESSSSAAGSRHMTWINMPVFCQRQFIRRPCGCRG